MTGADVVVLVAAVLVAASALVLVAAVTVLVGQVRRIERALDALCEEAVPLVVGARAAMDQANTELARVESVLEGTSAVTATVDSASRLAQRAFGNPVVKILAVRAGAAAGMRSLRSPAGAGRSGPARPAGPRSAPMHGRGR